MFATAEFWVAVAFFGFLGLVGKKAYEHMGAMLDERSAKVKGQIDHAKELLENAENLLATYQQKHEEAVDQSVEIVAHSEREAMELQKSSERDLHHQMKLREESCLARIAQAEKDAKDALKAQLSEDAIAIVEQVLREEVKEEKKFTDAALKEIEGADIKLSA